MKTVLITFHITEEEKQKAVAELEKYGMTMSAFLRNCLGELQKLPEQATPSQIITEKVINTSAETSNDS